MAKEQSSERHKSKRHTKKSKTMKSKKYEREYSSSSDSRSSAEEWVESTGAAAKPSSSVSRTPVLAEERQMSADGWLQNLGVSLTESTQQRRLDRGEQRRLARAAEDRERQEKLQALSWKDTGNSDKSTSRPVGDGGSSWLMRALQRARQQAEEQGRPLEEIVADRWGSMEKFNEMLEQAGGGSGSRSSDSSKRPNDSTSAGDGPRTSRGWKRSDKSSRYSDHHSDSLRSRGDRNSQGRSQSRSPVRSSTGSYRRHYDSNRASASGGKSRHSSDKQIADDHRSEKQRRSFAGRSVEGATTAISQQRSSPTSESPAACSPNHKPEVEEQQEDSAAPLTVAEMNDLAARALRAELNDDLELAQRLRTKLQSARETAGPAPHHSQQQRREGGPQNQVVVLNGGVSNSRSTSEKTGVKQMLQHERMDSGSDDQLTCLTRRGLHLPSRHNDEWNVDDVFEKESSRQLSEKRQKREDQRCEQRQQRQALLHHRAETQCSRCVDNKCTPRHLICSLTDKCYLALPAGRSLVTGHCLLIPCHHVSSWLQADEDVWHEMSRMKSSLQRMFAERQCRLVVFESALKLNRRPHAVLHCVPVPEDTAHLAPIYFKKALQECESEWSDNRKVISLKDKTLKTAIPRGLDYFYVDFASTAGFAHIVEDVNVFPESFGQEVIAGMLELEPSVWRKSGRPLSFTEQCDKVNQFCRDWAQFDHTKT